MKTRSFTGFGENGLLGFGCMRFPTLPDGKIDREKTFAMLDAAYDGGVTYYDTAYPYHAQESEEVVGLWQKTKPRHSLRIATKLPVWLIHDAGEAREIFAKQLARLQTDCIDFYLLHGLTAERWENILQQGLLPLLDEWRAQGKIQRVGFSFHDGYDAFEKILHDWKWDFCQLQLNYTDTQKQAGLQGYRLAEQEQIPVVVMEPVKGGRLARVPDEAQARFTALHPDWSCSSWALRWAASLPGVAVVLSGMSTMEQVQDNLATFSDPALTLEERKAVAFAADQFSALQKVPCTGCGYCLPCPSGIGIPDIFELYNNGVMFDAVQTSKKSYAAIEEAQQATACVSCGRCVKLCPQQIDIPAMLKEAHAYLQD